MITRPENNDYQKYWTTRWKADDIYRLIDFSRGDKHTVESLNETNVDATVLKFFEELLSDIRIERTNHERVRYGKIDQ